MSKIENFETTPKDVKTYGKYGEECQTNFFRMMSKRKKISTKCQKTQEHVEEISK